MSFAPLVLVASILLGQDTENLIDDDKIKRALNRALGAAEREKGYRSLDTLLKEGPEEDPDVETIPPGTGELDSTGLYEKLLKSTLIIAIRYKCDSCTRNHLRTASAFAIAPDVIATNHHVVEKGGTAAIAVDFRGKGHSFRKILFTDEDADLAIIRVQGEPLTPLPLARTLPGTGEPVFVLSHPAQHFWVFTQGTVSRITHRRGRGVVVNVTAPYARGSSGAPIVNRNGNVIAVVKSTSSIYSEPHSTGKAPEGQLQMVIRQTVPGRKIRQLLGSD